MKNGRFSGSGEIVSGLVKCGEKYLEKYLLQLINGCLEQNKIPKPKKISYVTSIYKKASKKDPGNCRGININNIVSKLFAKITINCKRVQSTLLAKVKMVSM